MTAAAAVVAMFALLVQALVPTAAMAAPQSGGMMVLCTATGVESVAAPDLPPTGKPSAR